MNNELGNLIKNQREKLGISQRELARRINVDNTLISKIEMGKIGTPNFFIVIQLSNILEIPLVDLLEVCNYDVIDADMLHQLAMYEDIAPIIVKNYENDNKINLEKVVEDYKHNIINEIEAFTVFAYALGISKGDAESLSVGIMIANQFKK